MTVPVVPEREPWHPPPARTMAAMATPDGDRTKALNHAKSGQHHFKSVFPNHVILNALGRCPCVQGHSAGPEALCPLKGPIVTPEPAPSDSRNNRPLCGPQRPARSRPRWAVRALCCVFQVSIGGLKSTAWAAARALIRNACSSLLLNVAEAQLLPTVLSRRRAEPVGTTGSRMGGSGGGSQSRTVRR